MLRRVGEMKSFSGACEIRVTSLRPQRIPSWPAVWLMPVAQRWLAALPSYAPDTLCGVCVCLVHDAVVPRDLYRLKPSETQSD